MHILMRCYDINCKKYHRYRIHIVKHFNIGVHVGGIQWSMGRSNSMRQYHKVQKNPLRLKPSSLPSKHCLEHLSVPHQKYFPSEGDFNPKQVIRLHHFQTAWPTEDKNIYAQQGMAFGLSSYCQWIYNVWSRTGEDTGLDFQGEWR